MQNWILGNGNAKLKMRFRIQIWTDLGRFRIQILGRFLKLDLGRFLDRNANWKLGLVLKFKVSQ